MTKTICVAYSSRADKSPLEPVIAALMKTKGLEINHLNLPSHMDSLVGFSSSAKKASDYFNLNETDLLLVLGDRYETLAACGAATVAQVPIAHIHGGEATEGSFDDAIRNAITKLSHIHFVSCEAYEERLIRMGEAKERIWNVGAPGLDNLSDILKEGPRERAKHFVITYHPETLGDSSGVKALVDALAKFPDYQIYWTGVNNDPGHEKITATLNYSLKVNWSVESYLRHCRHAAAVIGNSSSFIIECPSLGVPTVNIGDRQKGRETSFGTINCKANAQDIESAIGGAIGFGNLGPNVHGGPGASSKIAELLTGLTIEIRKKAA